MLDQHLSDAAFGLVGALALPVGTPSLDFGPFLGAFSAPVHCLQFLSQRLDSFPDSLPDSRKDVRRRMTGRTSARISFACWPRLCQGDKHPDSPIIARLFRPVFATYKPFGREGRYPPGNCYLRVGHAAAVVIPDSRPDIIHDVPHAVSAAMTGRPSAVEAHMPSGKRH